jgi:hypothetical protein
MLYKLSVMFQALVGFLEQLDDEMKVKRFS